MKRIICLIKRSTRVLSDFVYNIIATLLQTAILQIVIYPFLAKAYNSEEYGHILTIMGIVNIFIVALGGGLNNTRLIQKGEYEKKEKQGDFNILLFGFLLVFIIPFIVMAIYFDANGIVLIFLVLCVVFGTISAYWVVAYRLFINYKMILIYNVSRCIGYFVGYFLVKITSIWSIAFFAGELFGLVFLLLTTEIHRERWGRTILFNKTCKIYLTLICTNFIANTIIYIDRIFLNPVLGGEQVTIYTVSSFVGKSVGMLVTPMAGVLLSYYAKAEFRMTIKRYWKINGLIMTLGMIIGAGVVLLAPFITSILYPTIIDDAMRYIYIANLASLIGAVSNILSPTVLKYATIYWQIFLQVVYAIMYLGIGYLLLKQNGLLGFCFATLIVNAIRMILYMLIGHFSIKRNQVEV